MNITIYVNYNIYLGQFSSDAVNSFTKTVRKGVFGKELLSLQYAIF